MSKWMSASGCPSSAWSACPTRAFARAAIACARRFATRDSSSPSHRITINLAPADVRKAGSAFDLPIALGILAAEGVVRCARARRDIVLVGELSLDGTIHGARGVLPIAAAARRRGAAALLLPAANAAEAAVVDGLRLLPVSYARAKRSTCSISRRIAVARGRLARPPPMHDASVQRRRRSILRDLRGQPSPAARSRSRRPAATTC